MSTLHPRRANLVYLVCFTLLLSLPAFANNVTVDCSGVNGNAFHSITAALATLSLTGPNVITVGGTCTENVAVSQFDRLTIQAANGHVATIVNAANPPGITLLIAGSHNIDLTNLIIEGGGSPSAVYVTSSSTAVNMQNCSVQNSTGDGMDVDMASELVVQNSNFTNNASEGIFVANESMMTMATYPTQRINITGNGFGNGNGNGGLAIDGSQVQLNFGVATISGNAGPGISMDGGRLLFFGGEAATPGVIENNNYGISMNDAAAATLFSAFYIANNASTGISVNGASSITFYSGIDSQGKNTFTTIAGHSTVGMALSQSSAAQMYGPTLSPRTAAPTRTPRRAAASRWKVRH